MRTPAAWNKEAQFAGLVRHRRRPCRHLGWLLGFEAGRLLLDPGILIEYSSQSDGDAVEPVLRYAGPDL